MFSVSCAKKKKPISYVADVPYMKKSELDGKIFLIKKIIEKVDPTIDLSQAFPGSGGVLGLTKAVFKRDSIQFRIIDNPNTPDTATSKIALAFPVDYFDITHNVNDYGEKTNTISEDQRNKWEGRKFVRINWSAPITKEHNASNSLNSSWMQKYNTQSIELQEELAKDTKGNYNFLTEEVISTNVGPTETAGKTVHVRTHFLKVNKSSFKPVPYSKKDFQKFGFFRTYENKKNFAERLLEKNEINYAHKFNICHSKLKLPCSTNKVTYYLHEDFPERFVNLAVKIIEQWNKTFKKALGRKDDIITLVTDKRSQWYDPSTNMIIYVDQQLQNSSIGGFGLPTVNPLTGEILSAHTYIYQEGVSGPSVDVEMYLQCYFNTDKCRLNKHLKINVSLDANEDQKILKLKPVTAKDNKNNISLTSNPFSDINSILTYNFSSRTSIADFNLGEKFNKGYDSLDFKKSPTLVASSGALKAKTLLKKIPSLAHDTDFTGLGGISTNGPDQQLESRTENLKLLQIQNELMEAGVHNAAFISAPVNHFLFQTLKFYKNKKMSKFKISKVIKKIKDDIEKRTFHFLLLHELGHNFGLVHNFHASTDRENFYDEYKGALEKNLNKDNEFVESHLDYATSSIMDYNRTFQSPKVGPGKYDLAAIKYVYSHKSIKPDKDYKYCSDKLVGTSTLCQMHDFGVNVSDSILNYIDDYEQNFPLVNFTNGRKAPSSENAFRFYRSYVSRKFSRIQLPIHELNNYLSKELKSTTFNAKNLCKHPGVLKSIELKEITAFCNKDTSKDKTQLLAISRLASLLINDKNIYHKHYKQYELGGFADMVFAAVKSLNFFTKNIYLPEPGFYRIYPDIDNPSKILQAQFISETKPDLSIFPNPSNLYEVTAGYFAKFSFPKFTGSEEFYEIQRIGHSTDKSLSSEALFSPPMISTDKLLNHQGFITSAYHLPLYRDFLQGFMKTFVSQADISPYKYSAFHLGQNKTLNFIPNFPDTLKHSVVLKSILNFSTFNNYDYLKTLKFCINNEGGCDSKLLDDNQKVTVSSANLQDEFSASQNLNFDSISFDLLQSIEKISKKYEVALTNSKGDVAKKTLDKVFNTIISADKQRFIRENSEFLIANELSHLNEDLLNSDNPNSIHSYLLDIIKSKQILFGPMTADKEALIHKANLLKGKLAKFSDYIQSDDFIESDQEKFKTKENLKNFQRAANLLRQQVSTLHKVVNAPLIVGGLYDQLSKEEDMIYFIRKIYNNFMN